MPRLGKTGKLLLLLSVVAAGGPLSRAQVLPVRHWDLTAPFSSYIHESWGTEQGLPGEVVNAIAETPDGYIWLGTQSGLVRFNGVAFRVSDRYNSPSMKNEFIRRLAVAGDSALWVGTDHGGILSIRAGVMSALTPLDSVSSYAVRVMLSCTNGSILVSIPGEGAWGWNPSNSPGGVWKTLSTSRPMKSVWASYEDADGSLWLGEQGALVHIKGRSEIWYGRSSGIPGAQVCSLLRDERGDLLVGTRQRGLFVLRGEKFVPLPGSGPLSHATVTSLCRDEGGGVWIGTAESGLWHHDGRSVIPCTAGSGASPLQIGSLFRDNQGNIWFGTHGDGLHRLRRSNVRYVRVAEPGVSPQVWSVAVDVGGMWIGTRGSGIRRIVNGRIVSPPMPGNLATMTVGALLEEPDGTLWIGGESGLFRMAGGTITELFMPGGRPFTNPFGLLRDRAGVIWIGGEGLFTYAGGTIRDVRGLPAGLSVNFLLQDRKGDVWIASDANGVGCLAGGVISFYSTEYGLSSNTILCLYEDGEGCIWAGTQGGGLNRFHDGRWRSLTTAGGLLNNYVNTIIRADNGEIWMSTNKGLFGTIERSVIDVTGGRLQALEGVSIEAKDGLRSTEFGGGLQSCAAKSADGTLWFASVQGLVGYNPHNVTAVQVPPPVKIEGMELNGRRVDVSGGMELGPGVHSIQFEYVGLSFVVPTATRYRYYLEGYEEDWIEGGLQRQVSYTNLPPGVYVFHVTAASGDGGWNPKGATLTFRILPLFWQTMSFRLLCVTLVLGIAYGIYRLRVLRILLREKKLQVRVDEALANIKVLHGLIPICASCKKIRDDNGYWNDLAKYLREHSGAVLSHGICPECMEKLYGAELRSIREQKAKSNLAG